MADESEPERIDRRRYLQYLTAGTVSVALAGCSGGTGNNATTGTGSGSTTNGASGSSTSDDGSGGSSSPSEGGTFVVGMSSKASTLDLQKATRRPEQTILSSLHEPMFRIDGSKQPQPHLAAEYSSNDDATEFTFQLEEGVMFHNGDELTATDVVWSWERFVENSPASFLLAPADEFTANGDYEVTVTFENPYPLLPRYLTNPLTGFSSKSAVEEAGESYGQDIVVGTGPFKWEGWKRGTAVNVSRFEEYDWAPEFAENQGPAKVEGLRFEYHPEATTLLNELTSGDVHGSSYITLSDADEVEKATNTELLRKEYTRPGYLAINVTKRPTDDVLVREAITHATQKQPVIEAALAGEGYPIWSIVPPIAVNAIGKTEAKQIGQTVNLETARAKLDEAGWTNSGQGQTRTKGGEKLALTFYAFTIPRYKKMGKVIAPMLGEVGIQANLEVLEAGTLYNNLESGNHHMTTMAYGGNWAVNAMEPILKGENTAAEGGTNYSLWRNDEFDELLTEAKTSPEKQARQDAITEAQRIVLEEVPVTPICAFNKIYGYKGSVSGIDPWTQHPWWPDQEWMNRLEFSV